MLITYQNPKEQDPTRGYLPWLVSMLTRNGFNAPKPSVAARLHVSEKMMQIIQRHVDYIRVRYPDKTAMMLDKMRQYSSDADTALQMIDPHVSTYYQRDQLLQWLIDTPTYTRQTKFVSLEEAFRGDVAAIDEYRAAVAAITELEGIRDKAADAKAYEAQHRDLERDLERIVKEHCRETIITTKIGRTHRTTVAPVAVQPFDWYSVNLSAGYFLSAAHEIQVKQPYRNTETLYRDMWMRGAIRITFGRNKTYFYVPARQPDQTFLVPADF